MSYPIYRKLNPKSDLAQGDILNSVELEPTLRGHQDYFVGKSHFYRFIVLTQTCDLVRKQGIADYIFLAVVRKLKEVFSIRHMEARGKTEGLLNATYSYGDHKRGLFYLPESPNHGIGEESVADLRVIFSVNKVHYPALVKARKGCIEELFAAKLGQMAGNMFNRVAIPAWDEANPEIKKSAHIASFIDDIAKRENDRLAELLTEHDPVCTHPECKKKSVTFRWLQLDEESKEYLLCKKHAEVYDRSLSHPKI